MSLGINLLTALAKKAASILGNDFDIEIIEKHHNQKLDAPSGTAISLAKTLTQNHRIEKENLNIESIREGEVCGTHTINYFSDVDEIEITHKAHNRKGFALGAVMAAHWLLGKEGVFTMKDFIKL
jgi:4-hydroxy-tetrahydrodipicolinate reductase